MSELRPYRVEQAMVEINKKYTLHYFQFVNSGHGKNQQKGYMTFFQIFHRIGTLAKQNAISPFFDASGNKILVLLSALVEKFGVSRMRDFKTVAMVKINKSTHL